MKEKIILTQRQREMLKLAEQGSLTTAELAEKLDISPEATYQAIYRLRQLGHEVNVRDARREDRVDEAIKLRSEGATWDEIAKKKGYESPAGVCNSVKSRLGGNLGRMRKK